VETPSVFSFEKTKIWPPTSSGEDNDWAAKLANHLRSIGDGVTSLSSKALQELLLAIWSSTGIDNIMELAHHTREKATTIQSTVALNAVGKELTPSDFSAMAEAIAKMLHVRTAEMLSHIDSLVVHAATAEVLEAYIDELSTRNGSLFLAYDKATSIQGHQYGKKYSRDSYRRFVVESAIPVVYEEQDGATRCAGDGQANR
jgi:hypothetical protein